MPGGVIDGQSVNALVTNAAFLFQNGPSTGVGILGLAEAASSGPAIANVQSTINVLIDGVGGTQYDPATSYAGVPSSTITSGDTHQEALIALALKFAASGGHAHTGVAGQGDQINYNSLLGTQLQGFAFHPAPASGQGLDYSDVTPILIGNYNSWNQAVTGIVTNEPYNYIHIFDEFKDSYLDVLGNKVYGRLTCSPVSGYAPPTSWTLSYYSVQGGAETSFTMPASAYVDWYFQCLFTESTRPVYSDSFVIVSDQVAGEIPDANTSLKGKVSLATSAQSIGSTNSAGTANAVVANADHVHQGVHSLAASGSSALYGDVLFAASGGVLLAEAGQTITIYAPSASPTPGLPDVLAVNNSASAGINMSGGAIVSISYEDFLQTTTPPFSPASGHEFLYAKTDGLFYKKLSSGTEQVIETSLAASGQSALRGDVVIAPSGGISLSQAGQIITVYAPTATAPASGTAVTSLAASGQSELTGAVTISASGATQLGQSGQNITIYSPASGAAVNSLAASGEAGLTGIVTLSASGAASLTQVGQNISIYAPASGAAVNSIAASGQAALTGAVTIAASGGVILNESGQTITIYAPTAFAPASGTAVTSIAASGQAALTGAVTLSASGGIILGESGQNITIYAPTSSPVPGLPDVLAVNNSASAGINMSGGAIVSISYEDFFLTSTPPFNPATGHGFLYEKTDGRFYRKDSSGVETAIETTLAASGQTALRGDVTLSASGGIVIGQSGQNITIYAPTGGGGGVGAGIVVVGSRASPNNITASGFSVALGNMSSTVATFQKIYVQGASAAIDITANPQIEAGLFDGQQLQIVGRNSTNTVLLENGNGLSLNGNALLSEDFTITLSWDSVNWVEVNRNF